MNDQLSGAVGTNCKNARIDVKLVQKLLNRCLHLLVPFRPLTEDGSFGAATSNLLRAFQQRVLGMQLPTGVIEPESLVWKALIDKAGPVRPPNVEAFIQGKPAAARKVKLDWGIPVAVCLAQAALESGWGHMVKDNAYFGIKGKAPDGSSTTFGTTEFVAGQKVAISDTFRAYKDFDESADDYGRFLNKNPRYKGVFAFRSDPLGFVDRLQQSGYATDPGYADKLKRIIMSYGLLEYDK